MSLWHQTEGSGPALVLLHGWGMHAGIWEPLMPALRERFAVTRVDLPGHGASPPLVPTDLAGWAEAVLAIAPERASWVGWSLGGLVAQQAALLAMGRVERLGLVASTPCFVQRSDWPTAMPRRVFEQFAGELRQDMAGTIRRFLALQVKGDEGGKGVLRILRSALADRPSASPEGMEGGLGLLLGSDLRPRWPRMAAPRVLLGQRDTLVPAAVAERLTALRPGVEVDLVPGAAHAPFLSHPESFLAWLERL